MNDSAKKLTIGIVGVGMVGGALARYFEKRGVKPFLYDTGKNLGSIEEVNQAELIFVCVPTPFNKETQAFDSSSIDETFSNIKGEKIVVIKSTVLPGTTEKFQGKYPQHKVLFNPEFLREVKADEDMQNPDRQVIGYTGKSQDVAQGIMSVLPRAPFERIIKAREAEMVKYFGNTFLSIKVIFANQIYDLCQKMGVDYNLVKDCAAADQRIGPSHLDVHFEGYRGYGRKCFPKDIKALIKFADSKGVDLKLHKTAEEINNELMRKQNFDEPEKLTVVSK